MKSKINSYAEALILGKQQVGAKAYYMALLNSKGIPVPKGIVLQKEKWREVISYQELEEISEVIPCRYYIVRSSAVGEDEEGYSWAGCFESIPKVKLQEVSEAIKKCGMSLYRKRPEAYAKYHQIAKLEEMGILLQEYMESEWNGVAFSVNPITGDDTQVVIDYQKGKAGGVVGGYGESNVVILQKSQDTQEKNFIDVLLKYIIEIEKIIGMPVDVEWIVKNEKIYITQARPVTKV